MKCEFNSLIHDEFLIETSFKNVVFRNPRTLKTQMNAYAFTPKDMKTARAVFNWKISVVRTGYARLLNHKTGNITRSRTAGMMCISPIYITEYGIDCRHLCLKYSRDADSNRRPLCNKQANRWDPTRDHRIFSAAIRATVFNVS